MKTKDRNSSRAQLKIYRTLRKLITKTAKTKFDSKQKIKKN